MVGAPAATETQSFSSGTAAIYIFNLIVGTGALALPNAFSLAGWGLGTGLLVLLAVFSYITASFVVESMAACNGIKNTEQSINSHKIDEDMNDKEEEDKRSRNFFEEPDDDDSAYLVRNDMNGQVNVATYGATEGINSSKPVCNLDRQLELAEMADMLFNNVGRLAFSLCMVAYLYGDLAIYCTAVAKSLRDVSCTYSLSTANMTNTTSNATLQLSDPCWAGVALTRSDAYRIFVAVFLLLLGPFAFFNVSKTKYLQIFTTVMRWVAFIAMVTLSITRIADKSTPHGNPPVADFSTAPTVFGVSVYAFMCHHSIPSLVSPIKNKSAIAAIMATDYILIALFYLILAYTGIFAFPTVPDLYTLAFQPDEGTTPTLPVQIADYFLGLFPVFTLSTNFPIIAITLRNNLQTMVTDISIFSNMSPTTKKLLFPLLATIPPALVALGTENLGILVTITGAYAGAGIQYVIPCCLVFLARRRLNKLEKSLDTSLENPLASVFKHSGFVFLVLAWSAMAVGLVTSNFIIKAVK